MYENATLPSYLGCFLQEGVYLFGDGCHPHFWIKVEITTHCSHVLLHSTWEQWHDPRVNPKIQMVHYAEPNNPFPPASIAVTPANAPRSTSRSSRKTSSPTLTYTCTPRQKWAPLPANTGICWGYLRFCNYHNWAAKSSVECKKKVGDLPFKNHERPMPCRCTLPGVKLLFLLSVYPCHAHDEHSWR